MIHHDFDYYAPRTLGKALDILSGAAGACAVMGGGTWLVPNMTFAVAQPRVVVDPKHLGLSAITLVESDLRVGARATYADVLASQIVHQHAPLLALMSAQITGGVSIVAQGTIGGSAAYANPVSDVPACLVALNARMRLQSTRGVRDVAASAFFLDAFSTALCDDEMLEAILIPVRAPSVRYGYYKLKSSTGSWPIVTAAALVDGSNLRVAVGAARAVPLLTIASLDDAGASLSRLAEKCSVIHPDEEWADELAGRGYRRRVTQSVVSRALRQCEVSR